MLREEYIHLTGVFQTWLGVESLGGSDTVSIGSFDV